MNDVNLYVSSKNAPNKSCRRCLCVVIFVRDIRSLVYFIFHLFFSTLLLWSLTISNRKLSFDVKDYSWNEIMQCLQKIKINFKKLFDVGTSPCSQGEVTMRFSEQIADIFIVHVDTFGNFYVFRRSV